MMQMCTENLLQEIYLGVQIYFSITFSWGYFKCLVVTTQHPGKCWFTLCHVNSMETKLVSSSHYLSLFSIYIPLYSYISPSIYLAAS